ncbi:MAG: hypothetical protein WA057_01695 [Candidatus Magasanikiibacteriota bacterium]
MTNLKIIENILTDEAMPIGVLDSGETFGLEQEDRKGNLYLLGKSGQGKTVLLEGLIISDLVNNGGGLVIDPFGDIVDEVLQYTDKDNVIIFEVSKGDSEFNINKFKQEINLVDIKNNKFVLCKLSYPVIGSQVAREVGLFILNEFYKLKSELNNASLFIDEWHNFVDDGVNILSNKACGIKCCLSDQSINEYSKENLEQLFNTTDHIICYNVDSRTAKYVGEHFGLNFGDLKDVEQYNFYTRLTVAGSNIEVFKAKGIFPLPYHKN